MVNKLVLFIVVFLSLNLSSQTTDWVKSFGGTASDKGISIGTDSLGFIYCSGYFNNEDTFGSINLTNSPLSTSGNNKENFILNTNGWDGKHYKTGNYLPMANYIYEVYFQNFEVCEH